MISHPFVQRLSGLKASAGLGSYTSEDAELPAASGARSALVPTQSLPLSSRIVARYMRKPITEDIYLEKPVFNQHQLEPVPVPFAAPITVDEFVAWRDETGGNGAKSGSSPSGAGAGDGSSATKKARKDKKDKKDSGAKEGKRTKRPKKDSSASPSGDAPLPPAPMPDMANFPPPPPGAAPPPPI